MATARINLVDQSKIANDCLKLCVTQLGDAAQRSKVNKEGFPPEELKVWNEKIVQLSKDIASVRNRNERTIQVLQTVVGDKRSIEQVDLDERRSQIADAIGKECSGFDENKDVNVRQISELLKPTDKDGDEELEVIEEGFKENDTICPYTRSQFKDPMKRHHISKDALNQLLHGAPRNGVNCPVAGCRGKWTAATSSLDEEYQAKVDRFLRLQGLTLVSASQFATNVDDEEYTAL